MHCLCGMQVVSIPFYIWNMLGTAPLRAAYLQQLLHICQAMQVQPTPSPSPYTSPTQPDMQSITGRTYSNSSIERINSALAAQWANPNMAAAGAASGFGHLTTGDAAAAGRAASCPCGPMTAGAATMHQQLANASRHLPEHMRTSSLYHLYDPSPSTTPVSSHELSQNPFPQGFRLSSQVQTQTLREGLQDGHAAAAAAAAAASSEAAVTRASAREGPASPWEPRSGMSHAGVAGLMQGLGPGQTGADAPLDAAQLDAVAALQSLALQLQATGALPCTAASSVMWCLQSISAST